MQVCRRLKAQKLNGILGYMKYTTQNMIAKINPTRLQKTAPPINTVVKTNIMNER